MDESVIAFKNRLKKEGRHGIAVDLDETLSWTIGFWVREMQKLFGNPENLSVEEMVAKYRSTHHVPYWQTEEALAWLKRHRMSDDVHENLPLIESADITIQKINEIVPIVGYITARTENVLSGTKKWLTKHKFPKAEIITRTKQPSLHSSEWKAGVLEYLYPEVEGIIDDNQDLAEHLSKDYKGTIYLYDNTETSRTDINIIPCKTWDTVLSAIDQIRK